MTKIRAKRTILAAQALNTHQSSFVPRVDERGIGRIHENHDLLQLTYLEFLVLKYEFEEHNFESFINEAIDKASKPTSIYITVTMSFDNMHPFYQMAKTLWDKVQAYKPDVLIKSLGHAAAENLVFSIEQAKFLREIYLICAKAEAKPSQSHSFFRKDSGAKTNYKLTASLTDKNLAHKVYALLDPIALSIGKQWIDKSAGEKQFSAGGWVAYETSNPKLLAVLLYLKLDYPGYAVVQTLKQNKLIEAKMTNDRSLNSKVLALTIPKELLQNAAQLANLQHTLDKTARKLQKVFIEGDNKSLANLKIVENIYDHGMVHFENRQFKACSEELRAALSIIEYIVSDEHTSKERQSWQKLQAKCLLKLGDLFSELQEYDPSLARYKEAYKIYAQLFSANSPILKMLQTKIDEVEAKLLEIEPVSNPSIQP